MSAPDLDPYLDSRRPLVPDDAVAALILDEAGRYLLQHRDPLPQIWFPDHWGCFGGAVEPGESDEAAIRRELFEELTLDPTSYEPRYFTRLDFDFAFAGHRRLRRVFYEVQVSEDLLSTVKLQEGRAMGRFTGREALDLKRLAPYDNWAIWMHVNRDRIAA